jgi:MYXO-CTERM domain-containing protein
VQGVVNVGTATATGPLGPARDFGGTSDRIDLSPETAFDLTGPMTVSAWIDVDAWPSDFTPIATKGDHTWRLQRCGGNDRVGFTVNETQPANWEACGTSPLDGQGWHHVAGTFNGSSVVRIFVDGVEEGTTTSAAVFVPFTNARQAQLGANVEETSRHFNGRMDEVRIETVARGPDELSAHVANVLGTFLSSCGAALDGDDDGVCDDEDRCPTGDDLADPDGDGLPDTDADGLPDVCDPCPAVPFEVDGDGDGHPSCDDCDDADPTRWRPQDCGVVPHTGAPTGSTGGTGTEADTDTDGDVDADTDADTDADGDTDVVPTGAQPVDPGCGCAHGGGGAGAALLAVAGVWRRRRAAR